MRATISRLVLTSVAVVALAACSSGSAPTWKFGAAAPAGPAASGTTSPSSVASAAPAADAV
jgi:hypothetical protein